MLIEQVMPAYATASMGTCCKPDLSRGSMSSASSAWRSTARSPAAMVACWRVEDSAADLGQAGKLTGAIIVFQRCQRSAGNGAQDDASAHYDPLTIC